MLLLDLPAETLIQIIEYVSSSYFREDLGRLTVCKQWYGFAHTVYLQDLQLSPKTLRHLLSSRDAEKNLLLIKESVESVELSLKGNEDWGSVPDFENSLQDTIASNASV